MPVCATTQRDEYSTGTGHGHPTQHGISVSGTLADTLGHIGFDHFVRLPLHALASAQHGPAYFISEPTSTADNREVARAEAHEAYPVGHTVVSSPGKSDLHESLMLPATPGNWRPRCCGMLQQHQLKFRAKGSARCSPAASPPTEARGAAATNFGVSRKAAERMHAVGA
jgi:hypothetical protein